MGIAWAVVQHFILLPLAQHEMRLVSPIARGGGAQMLLSQGWQAVCLTLSMLHHRNTLSMMLHSTFSLGVAASCCTEMWQEQLCAFVLASRHDSMSTSNAAVSSLHLKRSYDLVSSHLLGNGCPEHNSWYSSLQLDSSNDRPAGTGTVVLRLLIQGGIRCRVIGTAGHLCKRLAS